MKRASFSWLFIVAALRLLCLSDVRGEDDLKPQAAVATETNTLPLVLATTNRLGAPTAGLQQKTFVIEGPLARPFQARPDVPRSKKFAAGAKAFVNLFNPLAPVSPNEPVVLAAHYTFDPFYMNKSLPRAFRNEHTQEPVSLISIRRAGDLKKPRK